MAPENALRAGQMTARSGMITATKKVDPGSDSCELSEWSRGLATPVERSD